MSENRKKSNSVVKKGLAFSKKPKDFNKAIFAVREIQDVGYKTRGMACAVEVGSSIRLVTWRDVVDNADCNVVVDRFAKNFAKKVAKNANKYRLQKSTVTTRDSFSFLSVDCSENLTILPYKVPGNAEVEASELTAYSFSGEEKIELKFQYDKTKKEHKLITTHTVENTSLLGSPILVGDREKHFVGAVGISNDGKIAPIFITKKEFGE